MKKLLFFCSALLLLNIANAQDKKYEISKADAFTMQRDENIRINSYFLNNLKGKGFNEFEAEVRQINSSKETKYFLQLARLGDFPFTCTIEYADLIKLNTALNSFIDNAKKDKALNRDYIENKIISSEGLELGYSIDDKGVAWFITFPIDMKNNSIGFELTELTNCFSSAIKKIQELQN